MFIVYIVCPSTCIHVHVHVRVRTFAIGRRQRLVLCRERNLEFPLLRDRVTQRLQLDSEALFRRQLQENLNLTNLGVAGVST